MAASGAHLYQHMQDVPAIVFVGIEGRVETQPLAAQASTYGSVLPAAWSFMLALRTRGVGAAWTTLALIHEREIAKLLGIPDDITLAVMLPIALLHGRRTSNPPSASRARADALEHVGRAALLTACCQEREVRWTGEAFREWPRTRYVSAMEPRITIITLGVADLARSTAFYRDGLGLPLRPEGVGIAFLPPPAPGSRSIRARPSPRTSGRQPRGAAFAASRLPTTSARARTSTERSAKPRPPGHAS